MKLRKILAMLLSFTLVSASMATLANAELADPGVTLRAEVTSVDEYGPIITVTVTGTNFADAVMDGRKLSSITGAAAVEAVIQLSDLFDTSSVDSSYYLEDESQAGTYSVAGQAGNKVYVSWANATNTKYITNDTMKIVFAVDDADGTVNTVEEYNENMGSVVDFFVTVKQYAEGSLAGETYVGTNADCKFDGKTVVGTETVTPPVVTEVTITPDAVEVAGEATKQFTAEVIGTPGSDGTPVPQDVTWDVVGGGSITADGLFTAPEATDQDQTITVKATSVADATKVATATVTVPKIDLPPVLPPVVDIAGAVKTNDEWIAENEKAGAMFWIVTVKGSSEDSVIDSVNFTLTDKDADTDNTRSRDVTVNITGEGSLVFGAYTTFATGERLAHAMELAVTAGETTETSEAVYSSLVAE